MELCGYKRVNLRNIDDMVFVWYYYGNSMVFE